MPLKQVERTKKTTSSLGISVKGVGDIWVKLARCCMPVPGDKIIGFITRNQGVSVHRVDCQNMLELEKRQPNGSWMCSGPAPRACSWSRSRSRRLTVRIC